MAISKSSRTKPATPNKFKVKMSFPQKKEKGKKKAEMKVCKHCGYQSEDAVAFTAHIIECLAVNYGVIAKVIIFTNRVII